MNEDFPNGGLATAEETKVEVNPYLSQTQTTVDTSQSTITEDSA